MDTYTEILAAALQRYGTIDIHFPGGLHTAEMLDSQCYCALCKIKEIIADPSLDDPACFQKIEAIVSTLESFDIHTGGRHDFG